MENKPPKIELRGGIPIKIYGNTYLITNENETIDEFKKRCRKFPPADCPKKLVEFVIKEIEEREKNEK